MRLDGIHHVTAITADAQRNIDFYAGVLGLRLVKTTVNFDAPDMYHLYLGDEGGTPGSLITFFEIPGAAPGRAGAGMIDRVIWRVGEAGALDFWADRLGDAGRPVEREGEALVSSDPEGLGIEIRLAGGDDGPARAALSPEIPAARALTGIAGVRAHSRAPEETAALLARLGFNRPEEAGPFVARGPGRRGLYEVTGGPAERGVPGAGTVHHVAWTSADDDHPAWGARVSGAGGRPTGVIDRQYFRSIYFREPGHVLFEIATVSPGFAVDEDPEHLGEELRVPPRYAAMREQIERRLRPLVNPRARLRPLELGGRT